MNSARHTSPVARTLAALGMAASMAGAGAVQAQGGPPPLSSVSVAGLARLNAGIDGGGDFSANGMVAKGSLGRAFGSSFTAALTVGYAYEDWSFDTPNAFGRAAPWTSLNVPSVGANMTYRHSDPLSLGDADDEVFREGSGVAVAGRDQACISHRFAEAGVLQ